MRTLSRGDLLAAAVGVSGTVAAVRYGNGGNWGAAVTFAVVTVALCAAVLLADAWLRKNPLRTDLVGCEQSEPGRTFRRVRIRNASRSETLEEVTTEIQECRPQNSEFYPTLLRRAEAGKNPFTLHPGAKAHVVVFSLATGSRTYDLGYDPSSGRPTPIDKDAAKEVRISVTSKNRAGPERWFTISMDGTGKPHLYEVTPLRRFFGIFQRASRE
jgi:hypothetical protein